MKYDAYIFDVQGTILDFYGPVARALDAEFTARGIEASVGDIVRAWRQDYFERVAALDQTVDRWFPVQRVYRDGLVSVCEAFGVEIDAARHAALAASWQHLEPWPDVPDGLRRLRERALTATLSNTDMATMVQLFKRLGIDWDAVLTAELFGAFKPDAALYERTCRYLGVAPERAAMVASHPYDLRAAKAVGLNTIFVYRPFEFGSVEFAVDDADGEFDHRITDLRQIP
ncbi:haloacid dehalogenase type II [Gordonia iterans]